MDVHAEKIIIYRVRPKRWRLKYVLFICQNNGTINFADYGKERTYASNDGYLTWKVF